MASSRCAVSPDCDEQTMEFQHDAQPVGKVEQVMLFCRTSNDSWDLEDMFMEVVSSSSHGFLLPSASCACSRPRGTRERAA